VGSSKIAMKGGGGRGVDCELSVLNIYVESEIDVGICKMSLNHDVV